MRRQAENVVVVVAVVLAVVVVVAAVEFCFVVWLEGWCGGTAAAGLMVDDDSMDGSINSLVPSLDPGEDMMYIVHNVPYQERRPETTTTAPYTIGTKKECFHFVRERRLGTIPGSFVVIVDGTAKGGRTCGDGR